MEQKKKQSFSISQVEMEVSFDNVMTLDISKTLGNVIPPEHWRPRTG